MHPLIFLHRHQRLALYSRDNRKLILRDHRLFQLLVRRFLVSINAFTSSNLSPNTSLYLQTLWLTNIKVGNTSTPSTFPPAFGTTPTPPPNAYSYENSFAPPTGLVPETGCTSSLSSVAIIQARRRLAEQKAAAVTKPAASVNSNFVMAGWLSQEELLKLIRK